MTAEFSLHNLKTKKNFHEHPPLLDIQTNKQTGINCYRYFRNFFQILVKHEFCRQIFEKFPNVSG